MSFAGKTVLVTGSSRGIGKAIALKFAKNGANVVVAAKTVDPHPKLPGTITETANECDKLGGKGLAIQADLRDEDAVRNTVEQAVKTFGGLDVLVNNASAINLAPVEHMPMKRWDLVNSINIRGTYVMSKYAIPHLKKAKNPHIITLSPPILLEDKWFANNTGYTMSKYGMSLCSFGLSAELKGHVGVNTLWPKTSIWTAAMDMLGGEAAKRMSRDPSIMADAAFAIASRDKTVTGNFFIDEEVLRDEGVKDFDQYAIEPGHPLLPDFFIPKHLLADFDEKLLKKLIQNVSGKNKPEEKTENSNASEIGSKNDDVKNVFKTASANITDDIKDDMNAVLHFVISDQSWTLISRKGSPFQVIEGSTEEKPDVTLITDQLTFVKMANGESKPTAAFMMGKLKIKGNMAMALKVEKLFFKLKSKL